MHPILAKVTAVTQIKGETDTALGKRKRSEGNEEEAAPSANEVSATAAIPPSTDSGDSLHSI